MDRVIKDNNPVSQAHSLEKDREPIKEAALRGAGHRLLPTVPKAI